MDKADSSDAHDPQTGAHTEEPVDWDLVLDVELVLLERSIVPHTHHYHEDEREGDGHPSSF